MDKSHVVITNDTGGFDAAFALSMKSTRANTPFSVSSAERSSAFVEMSWVPHCPCWYVWAGWLATRSVCAHLERARTCASLGRMERRYEGFLGPRTN